MSPKPTRRQYLSALPIAGLAGLAGCISSADDDESTQTESPSDDGSTPADSTPDGGSTSTDDSAELDSPEQVVRAYVETASEDPVAVRQYFHPIHPFHPDNLGEEEAEEFLSMDGETSDIETEIATREVTAETVLTSALLADVEAADVTDALDGEDVALVDTTVTNADGETDHAKMVTATVDDAWRILALDVQTGAAEPVSIETRVVEDVTFDTEENRARVHLYDSVVADSVTVETENAESARSTETPADLAHFDVYPDPAGDEVVVTATVDGESRPVHREQYPPSDRPVDEITYEEPGENSPRDLIAKVRFTDAQPDGTVTAESTVRDSEVTLESGGSVRYLVVGVDPEGDEVVVSTTSNGTESVIHRERYHP